MPRLCAVLSVCEWVREWVFAVRYENNSYNIIRKVNKKWKKKSCTQENLACYFILDKRMCNKTNDKTSTNVIKFNDKKAPLLSSFFVSSLLLALSLSLLLFFDMQMMKRKEEWLSELDCLTQYFSPFIFYLKRQTTKRNGRQKMWRGIKETKEVRRNDVKYYWSKATIAIYSNKTTTTTVATTTTCS